MRRLFSSITPTSQQRKYQCLRIRAIRKSLQIHMLAMQYHSSSTVVVFYGLTIRLDYQGQFGFQHHRSVSQSSSFGPGVQHRARLPKRPQHLQTCESQFATEIAEFEVQAKPVHGESDQTRSCSPQSIVVRSTWVKSEWAEWQPPSASPSAATF